MDSLSDSNLQLQLLRLVFFAVWCSDAPETDDIIIMIRVDFFHRQNRVHFTFISTTRTFYRNYLQVALARFYSLRGYLHNILLTLSIYI